MAEVILLPVAKSILAKLEAFAGDVAVNYVAGQIKSAISAKRDLKMIADKLRAMCAVLQDADEKQYTNEAIKVWLSDLKSVVYDIEDLLDEVGYDGLRRRVNKGHLLAQLRYYLSLSSNPLLSRFHWGRRLSDLRERLDYVVAKKNDFGLTERPVEASSIKRDPLDECAVVNISTVIGRDEAKIDIISRLSQVGSDTSTPTVLPIVGLGGIGKTALAKLVYHDVDQFDLKLWACVSDTFDLKKLVEDIIKNATGRDVSNQALGQLLNELQAILRDKKYFLVLDDMWIDDIATWTNLLNLFAVGKAGCVILITTRNENVAAITGTIEHFPLDRLPDSVCWEIFKKLAFVVGDEQRYPNLIKLGRSIVEKCGGIPLVVRSLASLLRGKREQRVWLQIQNLNRESEKPQHGQYEYVMQVLKLSYDKLPSHLKPCFAYCALMPKDWDINIVEQTFVWSALGLLNLRGRNDEIEECASDYLEDLVSRSLFQDPELFFNDRVHLCKIHDLLHDLATKILGDELAIVTWDNPEVSESSTHILWDHEDSVDVLSDKEFPEQLLKAKKARTFRFPYGMGRIKQSFIEGIISSFSLLRMLNLRGGHFEELPRSIGDLRHLRTLDVAHNPLLKKLPNTICKLLNLEGFWAEGCSQLEELPSNIHRLLNLRNIAATTCQASLVGTNFNKSRSLRWLGFYYCPSLVSLWEGGDIGRLSSITILCLVYCPRLTTLPDSMKMLGALEELRIVGCEDLDLGEGEGLSGLKSLQTLEIEWLPKLTSLPQGIQSAAASLQHLSISSCDGLIELPNWLPSFTSLRKIKIEDCSALSALPEGFQRLCGLQKLMIDECPCLSQRCAKPSGQDYHLIEHVPALWLDGLCFTHPPQTQ